MRTLFQTTITTATLLSSLSLFLGLLCIPASAQSIANPNANQDIGVIELRNYVLLPGSRERFIDFFETNFMESQNALGAYILGEFRLKGEPDHFFWIRGFKDMAARSRFLPAFYHGPVWKEHRKVANGMLVNNDNVHLLRPLKPFNSSELAHKGIVVVDYYIANHKLDKLISLFTDSLMPLQHKAGIDHSTLWVSELSENDFPALPVFQDKNLLVSITLYKNEHEYRSRMRRLQAMILPGLRADLQDAITTRQTLIIYPSAKSL
jgi:hypothetical protein